MKRSARTQIQDKSLNRLLESGIPGLQKGNVALQSSPHVYDTNHEPASITMEMNEICFPDPVLTVHDENDQSMLLLKLGRNDSFTYQTESEIQYLVMLALEDTLHTLGLQDLLGVKPEISVFAYRPDIIVVYHSMRGIILVVEVKKPGVEVFESHDVGGQVYDYLVGMLGTGTRPFCLLTSYDESCIAYLNDGGISKGILDSVTSQLGSEIPETQALTNTGATDNGAPTSPPSKLRSVLFRSKDVPTDDDTSDSEDEVVEPKEEETQDSGVSNIMADEDSDVDPSYEREVMYTRPFSGSNAMKGFILAVRCAIESLHVSEEKDVPLNGGGAVGACALVNESGLFWTNLPPTVKFDYYAFPPSSSKMFYLWKDLGRGSKGRVFLCCNSKGKACAAKFFLLDQSLLHRQGDSLEARIAERERQMNVRKASADLECSRWADAYNGEFSKQVRVVKLNNLWCLLMPYFDPVPQSERESVLPSVKATLSAFKEKKGLRYSDDDLRWRHLGMRDGKAYLFDLGSLEADDPKKPDVDHQIGQLRAKMN